MPEKESNAIDLTFRIERQGKKTTKSNIEKELDILRKEGKQIITVTKINDRLYAYCKG